MLKASMDVLDLWITILSPFFAPENSKCLKFKMLLRLKGLGLSEFLWSEIEAQEDPVCFWNCQGSGVQYMPRATRQSVRPQPLNWVHWKLDTARHNWNSPTATPPSLFEGWCISLLLFLHSLKLWFHQSHQVRTSVLQAHAPKCCFPSSSIA